MAAPDSQETGWIRSIQRDGDRAAAEALVRRYYPEIGRYLVRQLGNRELAADLTQDVFVAALKHISRFDPRKASVRTWLFRIATNKLIDHVRIQRRRGATMSLTGVDATDATDLADVAADSDLARRALQLLAERPLRSQEVVRLKLFAGQTFAEIGAALGIPEPTAKTTYYRALSALREVLTSDGEL